MQPGRHFAFLLPSGTDQLAGLQYEVSPEATLVMRKDGDEITAQVERLPRMVDTRVVSGVIESSLYAAAARRGVPDSVISSLVDIFGWEIEFSSDLESGDTFRVAYEEKRDAVGRAQGGRVIAAEVVVGGKRWDAVYFEDADDGGSYYTPEGKPFGRAFLRYPLEFTRITSQFTSSRFHPLLGISRPHLAVDFAAPIGTPVRAIASGRVVYAGWNGGSGRYIRIDHGSGNRNLVLASAVDFAIGTHRHAGTGRADDRRGRRKRADDRSPPPLRALSQRSVRQPDDGEAAGLPAAAVAVHERVRPHPRPGDASARVGRDRGNARRGAHGGRPGSVADELTASLRSSLLWR